MSASSHVECLVIGAGVVGLAIARALSRRGREVLLVEAHDRFGSVTSSRNSEVIHAGIYYPKNSLKSRLCVQGKSELYRYCDEHHISYQRCGKLIVATDLDQLEILKQIQSKAQENEVFDLVHLSGEEARELEPEVTCTGALLSPSTGIIDSHGYMESLLTQAQANGALIAYNTRVKDISYHPYPLSLHYLTTGKTHTCTHTQQQTNPRASQHFQISLQDSTQTTTNPNSTDSDPVPPYEITCETVVNAAGLQASHVAQLLGKVQLKPHNPSSQLHNIPNTKSCKGNYFGLDIGQPFSRLIYPIPQQAGLGVHATLDLAGRIRFGPDVEWLPEPSYTHEQMSEITRNSSRSHVICPEYGPTRDQYSVDLTRAESFYQEIRKYYPNLADGGLSADYSGIRPKVELTAAEGLIKGISPGDFVCLGPKEHGVEGLIHLLGIESPGLTSSLALARYVCEEQLLVDSDS